MKLLAFFFQHSRKAVLLSMAAGLFSGVCNAALLAVINGALRGGRPTAALLWGFAGLCVLLPAARFTSELLLTRLGQEAMYESRMKLCSQVLSAPLRHLEVLGPARLLTTLTDDIPNIINALNVLPILCVNAALVVGCLVYMGMLSRMLFAIVMGFLIVGIASYQVPILRVQKILGKARKNADELSGHLRALTHGTKELKIHHGRRESFMKNALEMTAASLKENNISALRMYSATASWGQTLVFIVIGLYLFLLPSMRQFDRATLTGYTLALLYLMTPLQVIMNSLPQLGRATVALQAITQLGFSLASVKPEAGVLPSVADDHWSELALKGVTHSYQTDNDVESFVLGPLDLVFKRGELVFITGGNGSGKTTLIKLLTGLYLPEQGAIYLDNRHIDAEAVECYRQHFSIVFSDFYLFDKLLGLPEEQLEMRATHYLEQLKLSQKVKLIDGQLSTLNLSQGQRKRVALLTAYLEDRPIYVFDEWAADQDPYFKDFFYTELLPELKREGKTVLVISHDDRYYYVADRIINLREGKVVSDTDPVSERLEMANRRSAS